MGTGLVAPRQILHEYADHLISIVRSKIVQFGDQFIDLEGFDSYSFVYIKIFHDPRDGCKALILNGRGERIRTSDPVVPNQIQRSVEIY